MGPQTQFSERENEVVRLLLEGKGNKQIALDLGISRRTVEFHLSNVYAKLGVRSRAEAILKLSQQDLRESTGEELRKSTGMETSELGHNVETPFSLWRFPVNKSFVIGSVSLMAITIFCLGSIYSMAKERASAQEAFPSSASTPVATFTVPVEALISTSVIGSPTFTPTILPQSPALPLPSHTVNGYTAAIEAYYADVSHVNLLVSITGGETTFGDENFYFRFGNADLFDKYGTIINTSGGSGPAVDPALIEFDFVPVTLFTGDRFQGQFAFDLYDAPGYDHTVARFRFELDLPIYPEMRFNPKQVIAANGLEILLDSVAITPTFTQVYLCFPPPSFADWNIGSQSVLQIEEQEAHPDYFRLLFGSDLGGDRRAGSEPYWVPPVKNGRCLKSGFPIGSANPTSLTLTIPALEQSDPDVLMTDQLLRDYPGLSPRQAYYTYLEEHGNIYQGPWTFIVPLTP